MTFTNSKAEVVTKRYRPGTLDAELAKAQLLHDISKEAAFLAPAVVGVDPVASTVDYERLDCSRNLLAAVAEPDRRRHTLRSLLRRAGRALALIHGSDAPPGSMTGLRAPLFEVALGRRSPAGSTSPTPENRPVLQHGDFGFTNLFVTDDDRLIVIDPSPNGYTSLHPLNLDVAELDLAVLLSHLIGRSARPRALVRSARYGGELVDAVLDGYRDVAGPNSLDPDLVTLYTLAGIDAVRAHRSPGSRRHRRALVGALAPALRRNLP